MRFERVTWQCLVFVTVVAVLAVLAVAFAIKSVFGYQIHATTMIVSVVTAVAPLALRWHRERKPAK